MIRSLNAYHILNTLLILSGIIAIIKVLHLIALPRYASPIVLAAIVLVIKRQLKPASPDLKDPLLNTKWARKFIYFALGTLMIGIMFKIMHWPFTSFLLLGSAVLQLLALGFSFSARSKIHDENILDIE